MPPGLIFIEQVPREAQNASEREGARIHFSTLGWPCSSLQSLFSLELEKRDFYHLKAQLWSQSRL